MKLSFLITLSVFPLSCMPSPSFGLSQELDKKEIPPSYWQLPADQAAVRIIKVFSDQKGEIKTEKKVTAVTNGYVCYGGVSNINGQSNRLIRFGGEVTEYVINFDNGYRGYFSERYTKNALMFRCEKIKLGKKTQQACAIIQHFNGMNLNRGDFAISHTSVYSNPPTFFESVKVFDAKGKLLGDKKKDIDILEQDWRSDYAEAILRKSTRDAKAVKKSSSVGNERAELILLLRELLNDEDIPHSFLQSIIEGINYTCLVELRPDLARLSMRVAPVSNYMKRYTILAKKFEGRSIELDLDFKRTRSKEELELDALSSRFFNDEEQRLRSKIDLTLINLRAVGDEKRISQILDQRNFADHLVYEMYYRDRSAFERLKLKQLSNANSGYEHYQVITELLKAGCEDALLTFLENADAKKFSQCSPKAADLIIENKPTWKNKLQVGLIRYVKENEDSGRWTKNALEKLLPEAYPNFFDLKKVGQCLLDKKVRQKIEKEEYMDGKKEYAELVAKWRKYVAQNE